MDGFGINQVDELPVGGKTFTEVLVYGSREELDELKSWLFNENIRLEAARAALQQTEQKFAAERRQFQEEMKELNQRLVQEKKRLKEDMAFFDKKMEILKSGFAQLDADKQSLEKERERFALQKDAILREASYTRYDTVEMLFMGAVNPLALKKRYKDLLKIFHPDNMAGDHEMIMAINKHYEKKRNEFDRIGKQA
jgi:predicted nuclease with TOPRIM domain